jgi:hypothetical protein
MILPSLVVLASTNYNTALRLQKRSAKVEIFPTGGVCVCADSPRIKAQLGVHPGIWFLTCICTRVKCEWNKISDPANPDVLGPTQGSVPAMFMAVSETHTLAPTAHYIL